MAGVVAIFGKIASCSLGFAAATKVGPSIQQPADPRGKIFADIGADYQVAKTAGMAMFSLRTLNANIPRMPALGVASAFAGGLYRLGFRGTGSSVGFDFPDYCRWAYIELPRNAGCAVSRL